MKMEVQLRVLTLNCWDVPGISFNREERLAAIAAELSTGFYDLVALQEVWKYADYEMIANKVYPCMPYSYYFRSGTIGSGLCILSKGKIIDVLFQTFSLNGYAHKFQHGDWFGGKGVGLTRIHYAGLFINFYTAHLHAVYDHKKDQYLSHRVCQAFDFSQFLSATSFNCDVAIVAGDLNAEPFDVPYRLICYNSNMLDAFMQCEKKDDKYGATNETPRNSYTPKDVVIANPIGRRIDHVLYNYKNGAEVKVISCSLPLDKVPSREISYSDHEAVLATLNITKSLTVKTFESSKHERVNVLEETVRIISQDLQRVNYDRIVYFVAFAILFVVVFGTVSLQLSYGLQILLGIFRIILTVLMFFCLFMATICNRTETNALLSTQSNALILLNYLHEDSAALMSAGDASAPRSAIERI